MSIPTHELNDGVKIPVLGLGTWPLQGAQARVAINQAIESGYRLIDTATRYGNEAAIGRGITDSGINRDDLFVTSKLRGGDQGERMTRRAILASLDSLGLDYLDLYLIHWPLPMLDEYLESWQTMIEAQREGLIRSIGVSNFLPEHLDRLIRETGVTPSVNQVESHPRYPNAEALDAAKSRGIQLQAWSPLGRASYLMESPEISRLAQELDRSPAQIVLRWHLQRGVLPVPKTANRDRMIENARIFDFEIQADQMATLDALADPSYDKETPDIHDER